MARRPESIRQEFDPLGDDAPAPLPDPGGRLALTVAVAFLIAVVVGVSIGLLQQAPVQP